MPMSLHGGPGRAAAVRSWWLRALRFYHQFTALQGSTHSLAALAERAAELRF